MRAKHKSFRLGLTGGMGCGKSTVAGLLSGMGARRTRTPYQETAAPGASLPAIRAHFRTGSFRSDGSLNRAALATRIFRIHAGPGRIIHPAVQSEFDRSRREGGRPIAGADVLLFECGLTCWRPGMGGHPAVAADPGPTISRNRPDPHRQPDAPGAGAAPTG